jgi:hypothetical protein
MFFFNWACRQHGAKSGTGIGVLRGMRGYGAFCLFLVPLFILYIVQGLVRVTTDIAFPPFILVFFRARLFFLLPSFLCSFFDILQRHL